MVGSAAVAYFADRSEAVVGLDSDMRSVFFGPDASTASNAARLKSQFPTYRHLNTDIREADAVREIVSELRPDLIIHCAAQPSHDLAASLPLTDFEVNAVGTLNLLESAREHAPEAVFAHLSTNKVYGDRPNQIALRELPQRYEFDDPEYANGISETMSIDQSTHSLFGASKLSADIAVQEYGRYFGLKTVALRAGCITGAQHAGVEQHGFLSYLVQVAFSGVPYTVYGYKGKQVRDQIHATDVIRAIDRFYANPKCGAVYNLGGGLENSLSLLESVDAVKALSKRKLDLRYSNQNRVGDHVCYYSDLSKFQSDYPGFTLEYSIEAILDELIREHRSRSGS